MCLFSCYTFSDDSVAQWIERVSPEHKVAGSTPATVTITIFASVYLPTALPGQSNSHPYMENNPIFSSPHPLI